MRVDQKIFAHQKRHMGVKETPMDDTEIQEEPATEQIEEVVAEEPKNEEQEQIVEAKPKRTRAKAAPKAATKAAPKPAKKKETIDMKQRTICPVCKCSLSMHALLYTHSCTKEALAKRKVQKVFDEPQEPEEQEPAPSQEPAQASQEFTQDPEEMPPPLSYREILAREQMELRRQKQQRIVNPIRAHYFGRGY